MDKELKGYDDLGKIRMDCLGCGKKIGSAWIVKQNEKKKTKIKVKCCYCGDDTGIKNIEGEFFIGGGEDTKAVYMEDMVNSTELGYSSAADTSHVYIYNSCKKEKS